MSASEPTSDSLTAQPVGEVAAVEMSLRQPDDLVTDLCSVPSDLDTVEIQADVHALMRGTFIAVVETMARSDRLRIGRREVEDIMGAVVYLASDASSLVTGSALLIDGGWTAG